MVMATPGIRLKLGEKERATALALTHRQAGHLVRTVLPRISLRQIPKALPLKTDLTS